MTRCYVDFHIIQTVPPSNVNRDDTGSPKSAIYGGTRRSRVSSQAWKRATRLDFERTLDRSDLGVRTKRLVEAIGDEILALDPSIEESAAHDAAKEVLRKAGIKLSAPRGGGPDESGYLVFLSHQQLSALAGLARDAIASGDLKSIVAKEARDLIKDKNSIDLALFGRMVADVTDLNVDAAAQVAHAISVHGVESEYDYFTAVDDHKSRDAEEDAGAGMIGTVEFNSATLYRYATVNVEALLANLGDPQAARRAVEAFCRSFALSMPTGKLNTFANRTQPDAVVVVVREDQPVNWVGAFETPVVASSSGGRVGEAVEALAAHAKDLADAFGTRSVASWVTSVGSHAAALEPLGDAVGFDTLVERLGATLDERLAVPA